MQEHSQDREEPTLRAERAERRLEMALDLAQMVIWELDEDTRQVRWWGDDQALFGRSLTYDVITSDDLGLVHPDDRPQVAACWREHEQEGVARCEYRVNRPDGKLVWLSSSREAVVDGSGRRIGLIGVLRDITHRNIADAALDAALKDARSASQAKGEFLANMSHEIRTPLNGVLGIAGALAMTSLTPEQREMVEIIESSGKTLQTLLSDVLDLSRIESGQLEIASEPFDLTVVAAQVGALFKEAAARKGLDFEVEIDPSLAGLWRGDPVRLRQILSNLVSNAIKFTDGGSVTVRVSSKGRRVAFAVADTGIGFDEAFRQRLFGRFTQADASITRRFGGSGLGLSISKALAELMGGSLAASAELGQGATFRLALPLKRAVDEPDRQLSRASSPPLQPVREPLILLAEDHPTNRRVVEVILEGQPVRLVVVENGVQALTAAAAQDFDLILMDMQMPVMDGLAATREIRSHERKHGGRRSPICMLTANAMPEHVRQSRAAGADRHLAKPLSAQALLKLVAELFDPERPAPGDDDG